QKFPNTKGFLNASVESNIEINKKRAAITYNADPRQEFKFRNVDYQVSDEEIKNLYSANREKFTRITPGARLDEDSIAYEREQIYLLMKRNGYYEFVRPYVRAKIDTNLNSSQADVEIQILNPGDSTHQKYVLDNTYIRIQPSSAVLASG